MLLTSSDDSDSDTLATNIWFESRRKRGRCGVHALNEDRPRHGYFDQFYQDLKKYPERFHSHLRMSLPTFQYILHNIEPEAMKQLNIKANIVSAICVEGRLVLL
ncbi:hypothetical protein PR048_012575 [Dryococelus australis]|uniref:Uncharacterized protein n=1 Tax=Dryococelus australis TaxID=614101 RepID=A0ABQ9HPR4_9NEOP|nr:hypothetical protein PR048_012575 [Dryococelus australis]